MYSMSIFSFLILGLLSLAKINGEEAKNYTGKCNEIYEYLEGQGKTKNLVKCEGNDKGEVTELIIYPYCLENEQLKTILSYNTIETLSYRSEWSYVNNEESLKANFGCITVPTDYEVIGTLTNLKNLYVSGIVYTNTNIFSNIPKSVEKLNIKGNFSEYFKLTQKAIDGISKLTNLNSLSLECTEIGKRLDFSKFKNLKKFTSLNLIESSSYDLGNLFKNCNYLKQLEIDYNYDSIDEKFLDTIGYLTTLEELDFFGAEFEDDASFSSLKKLKNLTTLSINCPALYLKNKLSPNLFSLTKLKSFSLTNCGTSFSDPPSESLSWANLKNLEYLTLIDLEQKYYDLSERSLIFNLTYLGDLPSLKEVHIEYTGYSSLPENIGNLKNLEVLELPSNAIETLPKSIGELENLRSIYLYNNELTSLPDEIGNLKNLEELSLISNNISSLPESIGNLENLRVLHMPFNDLTSLPDEIGNLKNLEVLDVSGNKITSLPESVEKLKNLKEKSY